jgi:plastocyanin
MIPAVLLAVGCSSSAGDDGNNPPPGGNTVTVSNNSFTPAALTINAGEAVRFVWAGGATNHNVLPDQGTVSALPSSPGAPTLLDAPQDFSVIFPAAGVYRYYCSAHGANASAGVVSGMSGTLTVQ